MFPIKPILAFSDNYIWAIIATDSQQVAVVDPGDAAPVIDYLEANNLQLNAILLTHHHADHIGGVPDLLQYANIPVYGPRSSFITTVTHPVVAGDTVYLEAQNLRLNVMEIPAHTLDHIAYYDTEMLFSGDTLFTAGCGRIFEGTAAQMLHALERLAALDSRTQVYCGHEYTLNNLRFAKAVEPDNQDVLHRLATTQKLRDLGEPTVPAALAEELATNPFLRTHLPDVIKALENHYQQRFNSAIDVFAALREWKNTF